MATIALVTFEIAAMRVAPQGWVDVTRFLSVSTPGSVTDMSH